MTVVVDALFFVMSKAIKHLYNIYYIILNVLD
jgi:hypothetical protein